MESWWRTGGDSTAFLPLLHHFSTTSSPYKAKEVEVEVTSLTTPQGEVLEVLLEVRWKCQKYALATLSRLLHSFQHYFQKLCDQRLKSELLHFYKKREVLQAK
ncbi:hypothetical protein QUB49_35475 [Microcoleus sp. AT9_B4]